MRKVIITTGGTGGHIFPAIAVVEELRRRNPALEVLFVGGQNGPEGEIAAKNGIPFMALPVQGFFGRGLRSIKAAGLLIKSIGIAKAKIKEFQPDVVMGFGGYAAAASMIAAWRAGVPILVHEQNSMPGVTNRLMGRIAGKVCISLPDAANFFAPAKTVLTGNPVRESICSLHSKVKSGGLCRPHGRNVLVLGGSQGAMAVNSAVLGDLPALLELGCTVRIQTGKRDFERVQAAVASYPADAVSCSAFIDDMNAAYEWADLALCRAGATTIAELAASGLPALFVPFPYATHNHQYYNALQVQKMGAAELIEQKNITPSLLGDMVKDIFETKGRLAGMSKAALELALPDAAARVADAAEAITR